jgi:AraC family transcriptional regulator
MVWTPLYRQRPGQIGKKSYGVCSNIDVQGNLDYHAAVEVSDFDGLWVEFTQLRLAPQHYAVFAHGGHISTIGSTEAPGRAPSRASGSGHRIVPVPSFECYSEAFDLANAIGNVDIWIPIEA